MSNRREPPKSEELSAPMWVVTFSDLISLLVTFFVLLFTFSTMEEDQFRRVRGALSGARGHLSDKHTQSRPELRPTTVPLGSKTDLGGVTEPARRRELEVQEELKRLVQGPEFKTPITASLIGDGLRLTLEGDEIFAPGTSVLRPEAEQTLREVARLVRSLPVSVGVEAHVDRLFSRLSRFEDAFVMTRVMALSVAEMMLSELSTYEGWSRDRMSITPYGDSRPRGDNETPEGRRKNRRVDIVISRYGGPEGDG